MSVWLAYPNHNGNITASRVMETLGCLSATWLPIYAVDVYLQPIGVVSLDFIGSHKCRVLPTTGCKLPYSVGVFVLLSNGLRGGVASWFLSYHLPLPPQNAPWRRKMFRKIEVKAFESNRVERLLLYAFLPISFNGLDRTRTNSRELIEAINWAANKAWARDSVA